MVFTSKICRLDLQVGDFVFVDYIEVVLNFANVIKRVFLGPKICKLQVTSVYNTFLILNTFFISSTHFLKEHL